MFVAVPEILASLTLQGEQHRVFDLTVLVTFLDVFLHFALQSAYSRAPSFWESRNMDNTTLDFFPSGVRPLMPFLAFVDWRESMALNLPLVLFQSLFSVVLCWLRTEVRPD